MGTNGPGDEDPDKTPHLGSDVSDPAHGNLEQGPAHGQRTVVKTPEEQGRAVADAAVDRARKNDAATRQWEANELSVENASDECRRLTEEIANLERSHSSAEKDFKSKQDELKDARGYSEVWKLNLLVRAHYAYAAAKRRLKRASRDLARAQAARTRAAREPYVGGDSVFENRRQWGYSSVRFMQHALLAEHDSRETAHFVYQEICDNFRMLTDVRFKLLALLPVVAGIGLVGVVSQEGPLKGLDWPVRLGFALFGFLVTFGLYLYDRRNDELYDELISRGRRAEFELGVRAGPFLGRPNARGGFKGRFVNHRRATGTVYWTVLGAWVAAAIYAVLAGLSIDSATSGQSPIWFWFWS